MEDKPRINAFAAGLVVMLGIFMILAFIELQIESNAKKKIESPDGTAGGSIEESRAVWHVSDKIAELDSDNFDKVCKACRSVAKDTELSVVLTITDDIANYSIDDYAWKYYLGYSPGNDGFCVVEYNGSLHVYQYGWLGEYSGAENANSKVTDVTDKLGYGSSLDISVEKLKNLVEDERDYFDKLWR